MTFRDMHASYLDSLSGARDEELPPPEGEEEEVVDVEPRRYVRIDTENGDVYNDDFFTEDEVVNINAKLANAGEPDRWISYGQREEESAAA